MGYGMSYESCGLLMILGFMLGSFLFSMIFWLTKKWLDYLETRALEKKKTSSKKKK